MTSLVETGDESIWAVFDVDNHTTQRVLAGWVCAGKVVAKVVEHGAKETANVGGNEEDSLTTGKLVNLDLLGDSGVGKDDNLTSVYGDFTN